MNKTYYHLQEKGKHHFLEISEDLSCDYLCFGNKKIKYRFLNLFSAENFEQLGYFAYKKLLDKTINNL